MLLLLSLGIATSLALTTSNQGHSARSGADQKAYALGEEGVSNATAVIFAAENKALSETVDCSTPSTYSTYGALLPERSTLEVTGTVTWSGTFVCDGDHPYWRVTSVAKVRNPNGGAVGDVTRVVTVKVPLDWTAKTTTVTETVTETVPTVETVSQTVYSEQPVTVTDQMTSTAYDQPGYTGGSFFYAMGPFNVSCSSCVFQQALFAEGDLTGSGGFVHASAGIVSVGGNLSYGGYIGMGPTAATSLPKLTVAMNASQNYACVTSTTGWPGLAGGATGMVKTDSEYMTFTGYSPTSGLCPSNVGFSGVTRGMVAGLPAAAHALNAVVDGRVEQVHARSGTCNVAKCSYGTFDNSAWLPPKPVFDVVKAKTDAAPGPNHLPAAGCPINFGTTPTSPYYTSQTVDLTPAGSSYTCQATGGGYGNGAGEIDWDNTTKTLKVRGVVYLPGDAKTTQSLRYDSPAPGATIYIAGSFTTNQNICGLVPAGATDPRTCDTLNCGPQHREQPRARVADASLAQRDRRPRLHDQRRHEPLHGLLPAAPGRLLHKRQVLADLVRARPGQRLRERPQVHRLGRGARPRPVRAPGRLPGRAARGHDVNDQGHDVDRRHHGAGDGDELHDDLAGNDP